MLETLTKIIREHTGDESIVINEDMDLKADLGLNSLELVNLVCVVEDEFDIEIPDRNIKDFRTVKDVIEFIEEQIGFPITMVSNGPGRDDLIRL